MHVAGNDIARIGGLNFFDMALIKEAQQRTLASLTTISRRTQPQQLC